MEGKLLLHGPSFYGFFWHPIDYPGRFVLTDGSGSGLAHLKEAGGPIVAHSGHDDTEGALAGELGGRAEQHVD